jgi:hypothetical protein
MSVWTKGSPFPVSRFPLTFCLLLFATDLLPGSVPRKDGEESQTKLQNAAAE